MSETNRVSSRRALLQMGVSAVAASQLAPAKSFGEYRALVCVYLSGGNDSNNMIVPLDAAEYRAYAAARGGLALERPALLPVYARNGAAYGLHPALRELRDLYTSEKMAVVANVGDVRTNQHRTEDLAYYPNGFFLPAWVRESGSAESAYTFSSGVIVGTSGSAAVTGGQYENAGLRLAMSVAGSGGSFPDTTFGRAMADVSSLVKIAPQWGMSRQVFTVAMSGFDTHTNQLEKQQTLFSDLSKSLSAFRSALAASGIADRVTVFTDSEFSRTVSPNSTGGTEHAWGGHHFVIGGALRGGDVHGEFPSFQSGQDVFTPTTSRKQHAAALRSHLERGLFT